MKIELNYYKSLLLDNYKEVLPAFISGINLGSLFKETQNPFRKAYDQIDLGIRFQYLTNSSFNKEPIFKKRSTTCYMYAGIQGLEALQSLMTLSLAVQSVGRKVHWAAYPIVGLGVVIPTFIQTIQSNPDNEQIISLAFAKEMNVLNQMILTVSGVAALFFGSKAARISTCLGLGISLFQRFQPCNPRLHDYCDTAISFVQQGAMLLLGDLITKAIVIYTIYSAVRSSLNWTNEILPEQKDLTFDEATNTIHIVEDTLSDVPEIPLEALDEDEKPFETLDVTEIPRETLGTQSNFVYTPSVLRGFNRNPQFTSS